MGKLFLLFTVVPFVELYLLLAIGRVFGVVPTIVLVLVTGLIGAWLARSEGLRVVRRWQAALSEGRVPEEGVLGGLLVLVGGVLLVTPGVLTDVMGFLLLIPSTRIVVADIVRRRLEKRMREGDVRVWTHRPGGSPFDSPDAGAPRSAGRPDVIDVEGEDVTDRGEGEARPSLRDGTP